jgi:hypothetical protein
VDHLLDTLDLLAQIVGHLLAGGLVFGVLLVAEGVAQVEGDSQVIRLVFFPDDQQHQSEAVNGVGRLAAARLQAGAGQGKVGTIGQGVAIYEHQGLGVRFVLRAFRFVGHRYLIPFRSQT